MGDQSSIEWTDATWNPVTGCTKVSPGCKHCYAETFAFRGLGRFGHKYAVPSAIQPGMMARREFEDVRCHEDALSQPLRWRKGRRIFVNSMSDLFHEAVPDDFLDRVFAVMALCPQHTFQILTKRPERMRAYMAEPNLWLRIAGTLMDIARGDASAERLVIGLAHRGTVKGEPLPNAWLGVSVETQHYAEERIPILLQTPAAVRFISYEPALGPVDARKYLSAHARDRWEAEAMEMGAARAGPFLNWVIVGGESGPGARPCDLAWVRAIVQQCRAAGVPVFVKQLGTNPHERVPPAVAASEPLIPYVRLRDRKGGAIQEFPIDLQVREFPRVEAAG